jgi:hypothetical protein
MTGIRAWITRTNSFGSLVMILLRFALEPLESVPYPRVFDALPNWDFSAIAGLPID